MGAGGVPQFFYYTKSFCCDRKAVAKFQNPTITPSWRKVCGGGGVETYYSVQLSMYVCMYVYFSSHYKL